MKFLSIEIDGFKSFARKTVINFDGSIVGIVGPNGSGKSNINDAIRWVLGSNSPTKLRTFSSQDLLFAGSSSLPAANICSVTLVFENKDRSLSVDSNKVSITRVVKRGVSGSSYFVNGEQAPYVLIKTLSYEIGLSKSSLAVISQGTVSSLAEANSDDRKLFIEETAGVAKHKLYKLETQKRLSKVTLELEKADHTLKEKRRYIRALKKQAKEAEQHREWTKEINEIDVKLNFFNWFNKKQKINRLEQELNNLKNEEERLKKLIQTSGELVEKGRTQIKELEFSLKKLQEKVKATNIKIKELQNKIVHIEIKEELYKKIGLKGDKNNLEKEYKKLTESLVHLKSQKEKIIEKNYENENERKKLELVLRENQERIGIANGEIEWFRSQLKRNEEEGDFKISRAVSAILEKDTLFANGIIDVFGNLISYDSNLELAVKAVLGSRVQNIIVRDNKTVKAALQFLKLNRLGKATFFPIENVKNIHIPDYDKDLLLNDPRILGLGRDLVKSKRETDSVKNFYLGSVVFCKTEDDAIDIAREFKFRYITVSLEGDIARRSGEIFGGSSFSEKRNAANYELNNSLNQTIKRRDNLVKELKTCEEELKKVYSNLNEALIYENKINFEIEETEKKIITLEEELKAFDFNVDETGKNREELNLERLHQIYKEEKQENELLEKEINRINLLISESNEKNFQLLQKQNNDSSSLKDILLLKNDISLKLSETKMLFNSADDVLRNKYQIIPEDLSLEVLPEVSLIEELEVKKFNLEEGLKDLKEINFLALDELEKMREDYSEQERKRNEITDAYNKISQTIKILEEKIVSLTDETIKKINEKFSYVFSKMFNGGEASIFFSDPDDPLNSGVDIIAKLPGKKVRNIKLFSGGEKSLIVISLLFSIILTSSLSFCVLDEVEAALDEVNLTRFSVFLRELRNITQFIVVTHRHATMTKMDRLLGLTMQESGISSLFSVELEQASKLIQS